MFDTHPVGTTGFHHQIVPAGHGCDLVRKIGIFGSGVVCVVDETQQVWNVTWSVFE